MTKKSVAATIPINRAVMSKDKREKIRSCWGFIKKTIKLQAAINSDAMTEAIWSEFASTININWTGFERRKSKKIVIVILFNRFSLLFFKTVAKVPKVKNIKSSTIKYVDVKFNDLYVCNI